MSYLIDDVARTLARPMPRRAAFKSIFLTLGGAFLATVVPARAQSGVCGQCNQTLLCNRPCVCASNYTPGADININICCPKGYSGAGGACCKNSCITPSGLCSMGKGCPGSGYQVCT